MQIFVSQSRNLDQHFDQDALRRAKRESMSYKGRETLVYMKPSTFLKLAKTVRSHDELKHSTVKGLLDKGQAFSDIPYLRTERKNGREFKVDGHEGRHRSMYLQQKNPNALLPVRIIDSTTRWIEDGLSESKIILIGEDSNFKAEVQLP